MSTDDSTYAKEQLKIFVTEFEPFFIDYVDKEMKEYLNEYGKKVADILSLHRRIALRGGKRVRASFVFNAYTMFGGTDKDLAFKLGAIIELIHAYLLIMDDVFDNSRMRRGGLTAHYLTEEIIEKYGLQTNDERRLKESLAICSGATGNHFIHLLLNRLEISSELKLDILQNVSEKLVTTWAGEIYDIMNSATNEVSESDIESMLLWKTANYTFENPLHVGALLAGANEADLNVLSEYSSAAGVAFQIQDDVIGMFGKTSETGKSNTDDLAEGKVTLLVQKALEKADDSDKEYLLSCLGKENVTAEEHARVKDIIEKTGALKYSQDRAYELTDQAIAAFDNAPESWDESGIRYLKGIARYVVERSK